MTDAAKIVENLLGDESEQIDPKQTIGGMAERDPSFVHPTDRDLDKFTRAYLEALWFTEEERLKLEAQPVMDPEQFEDFDGSYANYDLDSVWKAIEDCKKFQQENAQDIATGDVKRAGHDFWFTRNGHGAGFWDGDWEEDVGDRLTKASEKFGGVDTYVGDDGKIHFM